MPKFRFLATLCTGLLMSSTLAAQETPRLSLELNGAAETDTGSCRLTYVATNQTGLALDQTAYEVAIFDNEATVTRLLVLEFGGLVEGKTKILQFDLGGTPCSGISRIVINDAAACSVAGQENPICMQAITASSRTAIQFGI